MTTDKQPEVVFIREPVFHEPPNAKSVHRYGFRVTAIPRIDSEQVKYFLEFSHSNDAMLKPIWSPLVRADRYELNQIAEHLPAIIGPIFDDKAIIGDDKAIIGDENGIRRPAEAEKVEADKKYAAARALIGKPKATTSKYAPEPVVPISFGEAAKYMQEQFDDADPEGEVK